MLSELHRKQQLFKNTHQSAVLYIFCSNAFCTFIIFYAMNMKPRRMWKSKMSLLGRFTSDLWPAGGSGRFWVGVCGGWFGESGVTDLIAGLLLSLVVLCAGRHQTQIEPRTLTWGHMHTPELTFTEEHCIFLCIADVASLNLIILICWFRLWVLSLSPVAGKQTVICIFVTRRFTLRLTFCYHFDGFSNISDFLQLKFPATLIQSNKKLKENKLKTSDPKMIKML